MIIKKYLSLVILLGLSSCNKQYTSITNNVKENTLITTEKSITGIIQFPENKFTIKANINDVSNESTVAIIYPSEHPTNANKTIATGLTDRTGKFSINNPNFKPNNNDVLVLEATKRIGGSGNNNMSLKTFIKWDRTKWQSMTKNGIYQ